MSFEFLLTTFVIVASPGTGAIYTIAAGYSGGMRASFIAAFGCTLGAVPHMIAAISGLAALVHADATAFLVLKWLGVAYLLSMAWSMFREANILQLEDHQAKKSDRQVIVSAILINLLNPKISIFFLAFLPQFVGIGTASPILQMTEFSLVFMALTFIVFATYGISAGYLRRHIASNLVVRRWIPRSFAILFSVLAIKLAAAAT